MSQSAYPFRPLGDTVKFTAATTAPTPVLAEIVGNNNKQSYRIINAGAVPVFLGVGQTSAAATAAATVITTSGPAILLVPGAVKILSFVGDDYFTGITVSGTADVYVTPGEGL